jgi:hypothetical protein
MGGPSVSPLSTLVDWSDGVYNYVLNRIATINPDRVFSGIVQARSWPIERAVPESFYLLLGNETPLKGMPISAPGYSEKIQWAWQIIGTDIPQNALQRNRGDRYRINFTMQQELTQGMWPFFCEKLQYTLDASSGSPVLVPTSYFPKEMIWYKKPIFTDRFDKTSGILFCYGVSEVTGFGPTIPNP